MLYAIYEMMMITDKGVWHLRKIAGHSIIFSIFYILSTFGEIFGWKFFIYI